MTIERVWQSRGPLVWLLLPLSAVFIALSTLRRWAYRLGVKKQTPSPVPIVVVGNINVGGAGKTPLVIALIEAFQSEGLSVGVVSRGYGGSLGKSAVLVTAAHDAQEVGDEPKLIAQRTGVPVCIARARNEAVALLVQSHAVDVILSDDGLQHYAMGRDVELVVIDGQRRFGNGWRLPAGPLRESIRRLKGVYAVICNGGTVATGEIPMRLQGNTAINLATQQKRPLSEFQSSPCAALAGIGAPQRFFTHLQNQGLTLSHSRAFPDHHAFTAADAPVKDGTNWLMTEKDAVKCAHFAADHLWYVPVHAQLPTAFLDDLCRHVKALCVKKERAV